MFLPLMGILKVNILVLARRALSYRHIACMFSDENRSLIIIIGLYLLQPASWFNWEPITLTPAYTYACVT